MFLLKNRNTSIGMLKWEDYLDGHFNIDLSDAISSIYIGANFDKNKCYNKLKTDVISIAKEKHIAVFQMIHNKNSYIAQRIF